MRKVADQIKVPRRPFVNAQEMHKQHPDTFYAPSLEELNVIKPGSVVKVSAGRERFWVQVTRVVGGVVEGTVDNDLVDTPEHGLSFGDLIRFRIENVYDIFPESPDDLSPEMRSHAEEIQELSRRIGEMTRRSLSPEEFEELAQDPDPVTRMSIAAHRMVPVNILEQLATDPDFRVRGAVVYSPNVTVDLLIKLTSDADPRVVLVAQEMLRQKGIEGAE